MRCRTPAPPLQVSPLEKRSRIKEPPAVVRDGAVAEKDDVYLGKEVTVKIFEQTAKLMRCFDHPDTCLDVVQAVQEDLLKLVPIDPRGRIMFDIEVEDARNELELMEAADADETAEVKSEHGEDFREPPELIEEFMQTLVLLALTLTLPLTPTPTPTLTLTPTLALTLALALT